jgi:hypothetical protein
MLAVTKISRLKYSGKTDTLIPGELCIKTLVTVAMPREMMGGTQHYVCFLHRI